MRLNSFLSDSFATWFLIAPVGLVALKIGFPLIRWWMICISALVFGSLATIGMRWAFPPEKLFGAVIDTLLGSLLILPFLSVFSTLCVVRKWHGTRMAKTAALVSGLTLFAFPVTACFRWLPEYEVRSVAERTLRERGAKEFSVRNTWRTREGWTVGYRFAHGETHLLYLSRSGSFAGFGR